MVRWAGRAAALVGIGGAIVAAGSLLDWATVRLDLSHVFSGFPDDYAQSLTGLELGGVPTLMAAAVLLVTAGAAAARPGWRIPAGVLVLATAAGAALWGLYHVIRVRTLALGAIEEASGRPGGSFSAEASAGVGPLLVLGGCVLAMAGGVLLAAGAVTNGRTGGSEGSTAAEERGPPRAAPR